MTRLSDKKHWDEIYESAPGPAAGKGESRAKRIARRVLGGKLLSYRKNYADFILWEVLYRRHLPRGENLKAIEIGSAPGAHMVKLHEVFGYEPYGVEYSEAGVEVNRQKFAAASISPDNVIHADFFSEEFAAKYRQAFDVVISRGFIEHFSDPRDAVARHLDLLKPGGTLVVSIPNLRWVNYWLGRIFIKDALAMHNFKIMRLNEFGRLFDGQGLDKLCCRYFGTFSYCLFQGGPRSWKSLVLKVCGKMESMSNILLRLVLGKHSIESRFTSPHLVYIGRKAASTPQSK